MTGQCPKMPQCASFHPNPNKISKNLGPTSWRRRTILEELLWMKKKFLHTSKKMVWFVHYLQIMADFCVIPRQDCNRILFSWTKEMCGFFGTQELISNGSKDVCKSNWIMAILSSIACALVFHNLRFVWAMVRIYLNFKHHAYIKIQCFIPEAPKELF